MTVPKELENKQILIVDDVASMRNMTKAVLWDAGFTCLHDTDDGANALKLMKTKGYDLIICDWAMPIMSGLDLLKAVRHDDSLNTISFLMVTASSDIEHVKKAIAEGVTDYITKPFQSDAFCKKVITALT